MNIAIILEATLGGTRKHVFDLLTYFEKDTENTYYFIFSSKRADKLFYDSLGQINKNTIRILDIPMSKNVLNPVGFFRSLFKLRNYLKENSIEVVHLHGASAGFIGRLALLGNRQIRKIIYSPHGGVLHKIENKSYGFLFLFLERSLINAKCHFIAVSEDEKISLIKYFGGKTKNIHLIHNGIDIEKDQRHLIKKADEVEKQRAAIGLGSSDILLLYPALFLEVKGQLDFIKQFMNHPISLNENIKVVFAGDGPLLEEAKKLAERDQLIQQFIFPGFIKDMGLYYQMCDAVILFSKNEAFGYVLLEAMLYQKPIFASGLGGIKDIVIDGVSGKLYDVDELSVFFTEILDITKHKRSDLHKMGTEAMCVLNTKFNLSVKANEMISLYEA